MEEPKPILPTLHNISTPSLKVLGDQLAYLVRWYFANPGGTSSVIEDDLVSFRKLNSQFGKDPALMCEKTAAALERACHRYAPDVTVTCTYKEEIKRSSVEFDPASGEGILQGTYKMEITISNGEGVPIIPMQTIRILNSGDDIDIEFDQRGNV